MIEVNKIAIPFAQSGNKSKIYDTRQPEQAENEATWSTGFPPITMIRKEDGGLPPTGLDFNGIFYDISSNVVFACMGGRYKFDPEYAEKIGGYPKGAILLNDDENKQYISNIENNKIDFNTADPAKLTAWSVISIADIDKILANKIDNADFSGALKRKRDLDDNVFHGFLQVHADEDIGTGVFLICPDGKVRGQMVYNNYGLQFAQVQEDGTSQTFTFPRYGNGGEIVTDRTLLESIPVGTIQAFIGENAPNEKWLLCRGQSFSASVYPDLAKLLTDLKIPDLRGVALRGLDANRGFDPNRKLLSYQEDAMQKIFGTIQRNAGSGVVLDTGAAASGAFQIGDRKDGTTEYTNREYGRVIELDSSLVTRTNAQNETVMKNVAVNFIIKAR